MSKQKWNAHTRGHLYKTLVEYFGPYSLWGKVSFPEGKKQEYAHFKTKFTEWFKEETGQLITEGAVNNQIAWAYTDQESMLDQSHIRNYILNKAAALEAGFIATKNLPTSMVTEVATINPSARTTHAELWHKIKDLLD